MEVMKMRIMVAALEFGTINSGLAFSMKYQFETDPLVIHSLRNSSSSWSIRTPTCLLLNNEKQYVAFGYDAENRYAELVMDEEHANYYFFDRFTMSLHNNENVTRDMVLKDKTGKQCSAVDVFTLSIKGAVDDLMKMVEGRASGLRDDDILWVLTVPATWTDSAKQLMRESAKQAGLHAENVLIITEPEAAFTYCHYIPTTEIQGSKPGIMIKEPGTKSMVVDLGGVTADITVLQQTYNGQLKVMCRATEDDCGGASVDDRFCKMLEEIVGGNVITRVKRQDPADWFEMLEEFRIRIERFTTSNTKLITFQFSLSLNEICKELHGKDLGSVLGSSSYVNKITLCGDKLRIKADLVIKTSTIDSIITLMKNTVSNRSMNGVSNNISNIIMVGGFSQCPMIQDAVYKAFPDNQIIIPHRPDLSVLKGAALFGHRPNYIRSELCDEEGIGK